MDQDLPAYMRHPTLHGETIVFVADDDLWTVSAAGGVARRLTAGLSEPSTPCLSPDGKLLAFVGRDEQHPEVYVMAAEGGPARRLTWLGTDTLVRGWTPAGEIVYVTTQGQPFFRNHHAFVVGPAGGTPRPLPWGQINHLAFGPGERKVIGRNTADPARWKRYRGGTAGALWIDAEGSGSFRRMKELSGNLTSPMWIAGRVWFLGDADGVGNLYSCRPDGSELRRHTDHEAFYARHAQTDGKRIVYQCGAKIRLFDPASDSDRELDIRTPAHRAQAARKFVAAGEHLESFRLHPAGHSLALVARGQLFGMAALGGRAAPPWRRRCRPHAPWPVAGRRQRPGGGRATPRARSGWSRSPATRPRSCPGTPATSPGCAPRRRAAGSPSPTTATRSGSATSPAASSTPSTPASTVAATTSPGRPTAPGSPTPSPPAPRHVAIKLHEVAAHSSTLVTDPEFRDYSPSFDPDGKYLYFLSLRTYDPVYDSVQFELSFPRATRPYVIALQAGGRPPFEPDPKGLRGEPGRDAAAAAAAAPVVAAPLRVDLDGIASRVGAFPVSENRFDRLAGVNGRKVCRSVQNIVGAHGRGGHKEAAGKLERFDFASGRTETLAEKVDAFELARTARRWSIATANACARSPPTRSPPSPSPATTTPRPSRKSGWIDLEPAARAHRAARRVAADAARGVAAAARPVLGRATCRASTGRPSTRATRRWSPRIAHAGRTLGPDLGDAGRARHLARLRDGRRPPQAAAVRRGFLGADYVWTPKRRLRDHTHPARRPVGRRRRLAAQRRRASTSRPGDAIVAVGGRTSRRARTPQTNCWSTRRDARSQLRSSSADGDDARDVTVRALPTSHRLATANGSSRTARCVHERSERPRRLRAHPRHGAAGLRRVPSRLLRRVRARRR